MRAVTIREAKAHLNQLIDAATGGEQVVLMRGSKHVAVIVPITARDLELADSLTDAQAQRLWKSLAEERQAGRLTTFRSPRAAVAHLQKTAASGRPR
jgi:prevent-host-death family protein